MHGGRLLGRFNSDWRFLLQVTEAGCNWGLGGDSDHLLAILTENWLVAVVIGSCLSLDWLSISGNFGSWLIVMGSCLFFDGLPSSLFTSRMLLLPPLGSALGPAIDLPRQSSLRIVGTFVSVVLQASRMALFID